MKWISILLLISFIGSNELFAQYSFLEKDYTLLELRLQNELQEDDDNEEREEYPTPRSVLFKSMMVPGWGQIENRQIWKVPIIYGLFAGIGVYTVHLHDQYQDYRAAYYNAVHGPDGDFKFGPTPDYLEGVNANQLQSNRNSLRNQRDFMFVVMGLAYGLNILDAYVYAHMRSFDVSDDLSARTTVSPAILAEGTPGVRISLTFQRN
jgi:hypothetical protein